MMENYQNMSVGDLEARKAALSSGRKFKKTIVEPEIEEPQNEKEPLTSFVAEEQANIDIFENEIVLDAVYSKAHKRVIAIQPQIDDFASVLPVEVLDDAKEKIKRKKYYIDTHNTPETTKQRKLSTITEALFTDGVSRYMWLGEGMESYVISVYDDYFNNIDGVVRFTREKEEFEGFAVDLHCGLSEERLQNKFNHLVEDIINGKIGQLEYLLDDNEEPFQTISLPKFVIAIPAREAKELFALWHKNDTDALKAHPIKILILEQIIAQANALRYVATRAGRHDIEKLYDRILSYINITAVNNRQDLKKALYGHIQNPIAKRMRNMITKAEYEQTKKAA